MPEVGTAHGTICATAIAWGIPGDLHASSPAPIHWEGNDDPDYRVYIAKASCDRVACLTTASVRSPQFPLRAEATCTVEFSLWDPGAVELRTPDGKLGNSETLDVEIHIYRKGALLPAHFCIPRDGVDLNGQIVTLSLVDTTWYLQQRRLGHAQLKNFLDLAHWDGEHAVDGLFDPALTGWYTVGGATAVGVTAPDPFLDIFGAEWTAKVTAPGSPVPEGMGLARIVDCSHDFGPGLQYRFLARNWHPGDQPEFYFETPLRVRYYRPGDVTFYREEVFFFDPTTGDNHHRGTWNIWTVDIHVPPNIGGRLEVIMQAPESGHTFWGSRWAVIRDETFTVNDPLRGDLPALVVSRLVDQLVITGGETPYRNLHGDPSSTAGHRVHIRYPEIEHHNPYDVLQKVCTEGGVDWWWNVTPRSRTLTAGIRTNIRWDWPIFDAYPAGLADKWDPDAAQAHNRVIGQGTQSEFSRDQQAATARDLPGAVIDDVFTASTQLLPASLLASAITRLLWHEHSPDMLTASLPGDAVHVVNVGDIHPVFVEAGPYTLASILMRTVQLRLNTDTDRLEVMLVPWVPPEAL